MYWGIPSTFSQAVYNSALAFTFCLCRTWKSDTRELRVFSNLFWAGAQLWACVEPLRFPGICGSFEKRLFPKISHSPAFPPKLSSLSIVCPSCYPLILAALANTFAFKYFQQCPHSVAVSVLGEFRINQNIGKPFELVLQRVTRRVKINNDNSLRKRSILLPLIVGIIPRRQTVVFKAATELGSGGWGQC